MRPKDLRIELNLIDAMEDYIRCSYQTRESAEADFMYYLEVFAAAIIDEIWPKETDDK